jgi:hypothetical protein
LLKSGYMSLDFSKITLGFTYLLINVFLLIKQLENQYMGTAEKLMSSGFL